MRRYPVTLKRDTNDTILVQFPDVPEAQTFGDDEAEALMRAGDALETALSMYVDDRRDIPKPSSIKARGAGAPAELPSARPDALFAPRPDRSRIPGARQTALDRDQRGCLS
jgi:predicted RNase H-like HicB family nuclease